MIEAIKKAGLILGNSGRVFGADSDDGCFGKYFVDEFWQMPKLSDLSIASLLKYCGDNGISAIIPSRDGELRFFATHKRTLYDNGISVMVSDLEACETCIDKLTFYRRASEMGFPVIPTSPHIDDLQCSKYVVKERYGAGAHKIGLGLTKQQAVLHAEDLEEPVFQPEVEGKEVSVDVYVDLKGKTKGAVARTRDVVVNGESQITTTFSDPALEMVCSELAEKLGLYGHAVIQGIIDENNNFNIVECNSRFGGASTLSLETGLASFYWFLLEACGYSISDYPFIRSVTEKKQVRYPKDLIIL
ncbi:MAG: ATP-grasp domain-containing protein [Nitrospiraceae bacterium]|nr:MAG: ATP-grasp domain-containing protein [Nitrospiraceae bacterium]